MKEIKAYVRRCCVNKLVTALEDAGAPGITIVDIHPVGYGYEPNCFEEHFEDAYKRYAYLRIVKVDIVCADHDLDRLVDVIQRECRSGALRGTAWSLSRMSRRQFEFVTETPGVLCCTVRELLLRKGGKCG